MLKEFNFAPAGKERVSIWVGNGVDVLVERALSWAGAEITPERQKKLEPVLINSMQRPSQQAQLFPEVKDTLEQLAKHGLPMGIVTNKATPFIAPLLKKLGIEHYFL